MFAPLGFVPGITPEQVAATQRRGGWAAAGVPTLDHFMKLGAWFAGTPDDLIEASQETGSAVFPACSTSTCRPACALPRP